MYVLQSKCPNVKKFLDMYINNHGVPRTIQLDQAKYLVGYQIKNFCNINNTDINENTVNDNRKIELVKRLIQKRGNGLTGIKKEISATNSFHIKPAFNIIIDH